MVCVSFGFGFVEFWLGSAMFSKGLDDFSWCRGAAPGKFVENNFLDENVLYDTQKEQPEVFYNKNCSEKFRKIQRKTCMSESVFK